MGAGGMRITITFYIYLLAALIAIESYAEENIAPPYSGDDVYADTWVATDGAGRRMPDATEAGPPRPNKWVGIFYWTWHVPHADGPNDVTKILADADGGEVEWPSNSAPYHWGEPELGYYEMTDPFVIRKHASMLCDAGIDIIFFDTTNPPATWKDQYEALCREYTAMRDEGARTPAIGFICPFWDPTPVADILWKDLYQPRLWPELWFQWEGKPLLLGDKAKIGNEEMLDFFTFRRPMPDYWVGPSEPEQWSWLEVYPQHPFLNSHGEVEQASVGVAQNALPDTPGPAPMSHKAGAMGRSWHDGAKDTREGAVNLGLNFQEQWKRAMELDPSFVFVTGWNEWVAGRYKEWSTYTEADAYHPGGLFVDQYTQEYSRDCEPMRGGHTDNYYYQLAGTVRKFKGARPRPHATGPSAITIDGNFDDWTAVAPEFRDTTGDVTHRDHVGYGKIRYTNTTGRNDFVIAKAAYDETKLYFYAQTRTAITPHADENWMLLLLDTDQDAATGWLGYDYLINSKPASDTETSLHVYMDDDWQFMGSADYRVYGNCLELSFLRAIVREDFADPAFDFHWADNMEPKGDVSQLGLMGDNAPNRRWNYPYGVAQ